MALNIADLFEHAVDAVPDRVALICGDDQVTYAELEAKANRLAHYLRRPGRGAGDHVGIYAEQHRARRRAARHLEGGRRPDQRQLPLRRGRARLPLRERRRGRAGPRAPVRRPGRQRAARDAERQDHRGRSRTAATTTTGVTAASSSTRRWQQGRPSATSASAAPTTSTSSTPAAPPASPRA